MVTDLVDPGEIVAEFSNVAANGPIPTLLMVVGTILFVVTFGVFGYLSVGGVLSALARP